MTFDENSIHKIIELMYLNLKPSEMNLDGFKYLLKNITNENPKYINTPEKLNNYKILMAIVNSCELEQLNGKTQVIPRLICEEGVSTRLTHTFQVFWISFGLAQALNLDPIKTGIIALAHDLGHVAFGHTGERQIDRIVQSIKQRQGIAYLLNLQDYDLAFYDNLKEFKHENYSVVFFNNILKRNNLVLDKALKEEIEDGIINHGGSFGKAITMEGKLVGYGDKIAYLHQDPIDMELLFKRINSNLENELKNGRRIHPQWLSNVKRLKYLIKNTPKGLGDTSERRTYSIIKSLLTQSNENQISVDENVLNEIYIFKDYMYRQFYSLDLIKELEIRMDQIISIAFLDLLKESDDMKDGLEIHFSSQGYLTNYEMFNANQNINKGSEMLGTENIFSIVLNYFINSINNDLQACDTRQEETIKLLKENINSVDTSKVFERLINFTDDQVTSLTKYTLNPIRFFRWDADENPLISKEIAKNNVDKIPFYRPEAYLI